MRLFVRLLLLLLPVLTGAVLWLDQGMHVAVPGLTRESQEARIVEIISGDTIDISVDSVRTRLHIRGIEAPPPDQCLGVEARDHLKQVVRVGRRVALRDVERAEDGTITATVHTVLKQAGPEMVAAGFAVPSEEARTIAAAVGDEPERAHDYVDEGAGFAERFEAKEAAADMLAVVDAHAKAKDGALGLYDPAFECTVAGQVAKAQSLVSAASAPLPGRPEEILAFDPGPRSADIAAGHDAVAALIEFLSGDASLFPLRAYSPQELEDFREGTAQMTQQLDEASTATDSLLAEAAGLRERQAEKDAAAAASEEERQRQEAERMALLESMRSSGGGNGGSGGAGAGASGYGAGASGSAAPPPPSWVGAGDPAADMSGVAGLTYDGYQGCRSYSGFPPDAVDEHGRPFRKVDCATKQPLTPIG